MKIFGLTSALLVAFVAVCPARAETPVKAPAIPYAPGQGPSTYSTRGNIVSGPDGSAAKKYGNSTFGPNGETYETHGDTTYGSDGSKAETSGDTTFIEGPNGETAKCEKIGAETFCE
jgi:hypothetical protein